MIDPEVLKILCPSGIIRLPKEREKPQLTARGKGDERRPVKDLPLMDDRGYDRLGERVPLADTHARCSALARALRRKMLERGQVQPAAATTAQLLGTYTSTRTGASGPDFTALNAAIVKEQTRLLLDAVRLFDYGRLRLTDARKPRKPVVRPERPTVIYL